jgi:hypothetical protein
MSKIQNSELTKEILNAARINTSISQIPQDLASSVVPVIEVNPRLTRMSNIVRQAEYTTTGTNRAILTLDSGKEFILTGCTLTLIKDATCDMADTVVSMSIVIDGKTNYIITIETLTLTAQNNTIIMPLTVPIKLDKGSTVYMNHTTFTVGKFRISGSIQGYYIENPNA